MRLIMDNSKRNIHSSGPLGMLIKSGQIKKVEDKDQIESSTIEQALSINKTAGLYFKTQTGIEFSEDELIYVDPTECEPWMYANRHENEFGDIDELVESLKTSKQLQPALIRNHPTPHDKIKYEIIFGRRRHVACLRLGIPFLAIRKHLPNIQDAIASQDAENKFRNNVSNFSNAKLYQRLLSDGIFKTEKELAEKLRLSPSTLNDLMAYAKIPDDVVSKIPNIHTLSKQIAVKLVQLIGKSEENHTRVLEIAGKLGASITSQVKLEQLFNKNSLKLSEPKATTSKTYNSNSGDKLFVFKADGRGLPSIVLNKDIIKHINLDDMCNYFSAYIEKKVLESGYPD